MNTDFHTVHVRVNDAATGQPTPVRVRFVAHDGEYVPPFGRLPVFATDPCVDVGGNLFLNPKRYAYIDGTCEISLPPGPIHVEISKGLEYTPLCADLVLGPGQASLRLSLERWIDLRREGWYSGDARVHHLSPHAALLEGAAEDVAVVNLLAADYEVIDPATYFFSSLRRKEDPYLIRYPAISNLEAFSGQRPVLELPGHMVVVNTHHTHPVLGRLALLNCHRVVYPLSFGGPEGLDNWTLNDWCGQCHRKGGLVVWTRVWRAKRAWYEDKRQKKAPSVGGEALANLILGRVDALEIAYFALASYEGEFFGSREPFYPWYRLLSCGFRVPLVGSSGKVSNAVALGQPRTYARLQPGEEFTYGHWIEAVRAGRTFVTEGPLISFTVDGQDPGALIGLPATGGTVHVRAQARGLEPFAALEVVANGQCIAGSEATGSPCTAVVETDVKVTTSGWLAARCGGLLDLVPGRSPVLGIHAHTSPVYVQLESRPLNGDDDDVTPLLNDLDRTLKWIERRGRFEHERQRDYLAGILQDARRELVRRQGG